MTRGLHLCSRSFRSGNSPRRKMSIYVPLNLRPFPAHPIWSDKISCRVMRSVHTAEVDSFFFFFGRNLCFYHGVILGFLAVKDAWVKNRSKMSIERWGWGGYRLQRASGGIISPQNDSKVRAFVWSKSMRRFRKSNTQPV